MKSLLRVCCLANLVGLIVFVALTTMAVQFAYQHRSEIVAEHRLAASVNLHEAHDHLDHQLQDLYGIVRSLNAFAELNPAFDERQFEIFTSALNLPDSVMSAQLQPDGVIRYLTNREDNLAAVDLDLLTHPTLSPAAWESINTKKPLLVGPFDLVQGGEGMALRQPIFIRGHDSPVGVPDFWGFASTVFHADDILDAGNHFDEVNPNASGVFALRRIDANGQPADLIFGDAQTFEDFVETSFIELPYIRLELAVALKPEFSSAGIPLVPQEARGPFLMLVLLAIIASLTSKHLILSLKEREQLAFEAAQSLETNKLKSQFIATMSHEMRTPLNGVLSALELLKRSPLNGEQRVLVEVGQSSGDLLLQHVNSVLEIETLESGDVTILTVPVDANALVCEVADMITPTAVVHHTEVECDIDLTAGQVFGDDKRIRQILLNFAGNAVKFTRDGKVTISARTIETGEDTETVEFRVTDTGIGISSQDLDKIFDDFVTLDASYDRKHAGTGLGLAICRRIAKMLGAELGAESTPGAGSSFWVRVPLLKAMPVVSAELSERQRLDAPVIARDMNTPLHILLVDDNMTNLFVGAGLLSAAGHEVVEANGGRRALQLAQEQEFDLILMDISMPEIDGVEVTRLIRNETGPNRKTPIVALTSHAMPHEVRRFLDAGMQACLTKPFRVEELEKLFAAPTKEPFHRNAPRAAREARKPDADLDLSVIGALEAGIGKEAMIKTLVQVCQEIEREVPQIVDNIILLPTERAQRSHKLAGSTSIIGAVRLTENLRKIENAVKLGNNENLEASLRTLQDVADEACNNIRSRYGRDFFVSSGLV